MRRQRACARGDLLFGLDPGGIDGLGFFGLPGTSAVVAFIPEPGTATLFALWMAMLGITRRPSA